MHLGKPDPDFTSSPKAQRNFKLALKIALTLVGFLWLILILDTVLGLGLARFGLRPKHIEGLIGVFTAPLLRWCGTFVFQHLAPDSQPDHDSLYVPAFFGTGDANYLDRIGCAGMDYWPGESAFWCQWFCLWFTGLRVYQWDSAA